jgi:hypothetical protein
LHLYLGSFEWRSVRADNVEEAGLSLDPTTASPRRSHTGTDSGSTQSTRRENGAFDDISS